MDIVLNKIASKNPSLVEDLLIKSSEEKRPQTIYGDLMDWLRDNYTGLPLEEKERITRMLIGDYVIRHPYCLQKAYIVRQESNVDGEIIFDTVPCRNYETAKRVLQGKKEYVLKETKHFGGCDLDEFDVEEGEDRFYINDPCDDYYEEIEIIEYNIKIK